MSAKNKRFNRLGAVHVKQRRKPTRQTIGARLSRITIGDVGSMVAEAAGAVRRLMNTEVKRFDNGSLGFAPGSAGTVVPLSQIAAGDDYNNREGLSVRTVALELRLSTAVQAGNYQDFVRFIVFSDLENAGALPAVADVLEPGFSVYAPFEHTNLERFVILHDELYGMVTTGATSASARVIKLPLDTHLRFSGTAGNAASCREGALFCLVMCVTSGALASSVNLISRISYVDN